jgi:hypothetical protein
LGEQVCWSPEDFKAWSQNLGHEDVLTTFTSYGDVPTRRQGEIMQRFWEVAPQRDPRQKPDAETIRAVLDHLASQQKRG